MDGTTAAASLRTWLARSGWLPFLLSLLLHGGVMAFLLRPVPAGREAGSGLVLETCVLGPALEVVAVVPVVSPPMREASSATAEEPGPVVPAVFVGPARPSSPPLPGVALDAAGSGREASWPSAGRLAGADSGGTSHGGITFFQIQAQGQAVVYVIDRSSSMGLRGSLERAKRELRASLEQLPAAARFQVIAYHSQAEPLRVGGRTGLLPATPENKQAAAALVESLRAEGASGHQRALERALDLQPDTVFWLTDAGDLKAEQIRALTRRNQGRCAIHTIELLSGARSTIDAPLRTLAAANRGHYRAVHSGP
jgi:hypothetical protein